MNNPERVPEVNISENHSANDSERSVDSKPLAEVFDIKERRALSQEEIKLQIQELKKEHPTWDIFFDQKGNPIGLPPNIKRGDAIFFLGNDGKWYAQNPSPELIEEIKMWRSDWMD